MGKKMVNGCNKKDSISTVFYYQHNLSIIIIKTQYGHANGDPKRKQHCYTNYRDTNTASSKSETKIQIVTKVITAKATTITAASTIKSAAATK